MPLHVMIAGRDHEGGSDEAFALDKDEAWLERHVIAPRRAGSDVFIGGRLFSWRDVGQILIAETQETSERLLPRIRARRMRAGETMRRSDAWYLVEQGLDVTDRFISGAPGETSGEGGQTRTGADRSIVMVVYGHDHEANAALFDWLRALGLAPQEWGDLTLATGSASPFIGEVLEAAFDRAQAVVVLLTPDEHTSVREELAGHAATWRLQARPNVLFEAGMAFATHPERTVLVVLGAQELPSDLAGRHYVRLDGRPEPLHELANRLEAAGCSVQRSGGQWLNPSRFPNRDRIPHVPADCRVQQQHVGYEAPRAS
jgi:predicted nucleotide-binding protein